MLNFNNLTIKNSEEVEISGIKIDNNLIFNNRIKPQAVCKDDSLRSENQFETHNELTIYQRKLQLLLTEIYKIVNGVAPPDINTLFKFRNNKYNIRNFQVLSTDFRRTVNYGIETITYKASSLLAKLPSEHKFAASFGKFKMKIKKGKCETCPCRFCKRIQPNLGFVNQEYNLIICEFALFFYKFLKK